MGYHLRKRYSAEGVFRSLCSRVPESRCSILFGVRRDAIMRLPVCFGKYAELYLHVYRNSRSAVVHFDLDEFEIFE